MRVRSEAGWYSPLADRLLDLALEEDLARGDATTDAIAIYGRGTGSIVARENLVLAGMPIARRLIERSSLDLSFEQIAAEGDLVAADTTFARVSGKQTDILRIERTMLNLIQRCAGVATLTRQYVRAVDGFGARIVDTRKTVPGWRLLDKCSVVAGGGRNHRFDLGSGILIKDNHIAACNGSVADAVLRAKTCAPHTLRVEVEVETEEQLDQALEAGAELILLDNMTPDQVADSVARVAGAALIEVSGGVRLSTVRAFAEAGADFISVGALTHSAVAVDIALELHPAI